MYSEFWKHKRIEYPLGFLEFCLVSVMSQLLQHETSVVGFSVNSDSHLHTSYGQNQPRNKTSQMLKPQQLFVLSERIQC